MSEMERLDAYHFYEEEWESYDELLEAFEWELVDPFNIADYVCDRWSVDPERVALIAEDGDGNRQDFTYEAVQAVTNRLANYLREQGIERGDRVGVSGRQRPEVLFMHIAAWKLGALSVPLSTQFGPEALRYRLQDCAVSAYLVDAENVDVLEAVRDDLDGLAVVLTASGEGVVDDDGPTGDSSASARDTGVDFWDAVDEQSTDFETVATGSEDPALIIYTSGTTSDPKGTVLAHRALLGYLPAFVTMKANMTLTDDDLVWTPIEWAWIGSIFTPVITSLFYGLTVVCKTRDGPFDPEAAFELLERYRPTLCDIPPAALRAMQDVDSVDTYDVDQVRVVFCGGTSLDTTVHAWASEVFDGAVVQEGYGQTEAGQLIGDCVALTPHRPDRIGPPGVGHDVRIVDPETAEPNVSTGEIGEIAVKYEGNPVCFTKYWNKPEQTNSKVRDGWLVTEDLGFRDEDGYFSFEGRKDDVIICSGYRISPDEIEHVLENHPAVSRAGVVGVPDERHGDVPKAFVVLDDDTAPSPHTTELLQAYVRDQLAKYEYPRKIVFIESLPTTNSGKVRRNELTELDEA